MEDAPDIPFDDPGQNIEVGSTILSDTGKLFPRSHNLTTASIDQSDSGYHAPLPLPVLTFGIESSHPLIPVWPRLKPKIILALDESRIAWSSVGVFRRRQTIEPRDEDTTITVTAERSKGHWSLARSRIHSICQENGYPHLTVEMISGTIYRGIVQPLPYNTRPCEGSSIGLSQVNLSAGTMGGLVQLKKEVEVTKTCAMTCHHVLQPTKLDATIGKPAEQQPKGRVLFSTNIGNTSYLEIIGKYHDKIPIGNKATIPVSQPSIKDKQETMEDLRTLINFWTNRINQLQEANVGPRTEIGFKVAVESKTQLENQLRDEMEFDTDFGIVLATSGYKISKRSNCSIDWGLAEVKESRVGNNEASILLRLMLIQWCYLNCA